MGTLTSPSFSPSVSVVYSLTEGGGGVGAVEGGGGSVPLFSCFEGEPEGRDKDVDLPTPLGGMATGPDAGGL